MEHIKFTEPQNSQKNALRRNVLSPFSMGFPENEGSKFLQIFYAYLITRRRIPEVSNSPHSGVTFKPRKSKLLIVTFAH
jgi:hypothetical protein